jgi:hypothetical protein
MVALVVILDVLVEQDGGGYFGREGHGNFENTKKQRSEEFKPDDRWEQNPGKLRVAGLMKVA